MMRKTSAKSNAAKASKAQAVKEARLVLYDDDTGKYLMTVDTPERIGGGKRR